MISKLIVDLIDEKSSFYDSKLIYWVHAFLALSSHAQWVWVVSGMILHTVATIAAEAPASSMTFVTEAIFIVKLS